MFLDNTNVYRNSNRCAFCSHQARRTRATLSIIIFGGNGFIGRNLLDALLCRSGKRQRIVVASRSVPNDLFFLQKSDDLVFVNLSESAENIARLAVDKGVTTAIYAIGEGSPRSDDAGFEGAALCFEKSFLRFLDFLKLKVIDTVYYFSSSGALRSFSQPIFALELVEPLESCYMARKAYHEMMLACVAKRLNIKLRILRLPNVYGLYHTSEIQGLVNIVLRNCLRGNPVNIYTNFETKRNYVFAGDLARSMVSLIENHDVNDSYYYFFSSRSRTIKEVTDSIKEIFPNIALTNMLSESLNGECIESSGRKNFLTHETPFGEAIARTMEWEQGAQSCVENLRS